MNIVLEGNLRTRKTRGLNIRTNTHTQNTVNKDKSDRKDHYVSEK